MTGDKIANEVAECHRLLQSAGFIQQSEERSRSFGNFIIEFASSSLYCWLVNDRGTLMIYVGRGEISDWVYLESVLGFLGVVIQEDSAPSLVKLLVSNLGDVAAVLNDPSARLKLDAFDRERSAALMKELYRDIDRHEN